jgi:hypothetical protein
MRFIWFMASVPGRVIRFLAGAALILAGAWWVHGTLGLVLAVVGLVPLFAATFDLCLLAPLFKLPLDGREVRARRGGSS